MILNRFPKINEQIILRAPFGILIWMPPRIENFGPNLSLYPYHLAAYIINVKNGAANRPSPFDGKTHEEFPGFCW